MIPAGLLDCLQRFSSRNVFNPWRDFDPFDLTVDGLTPPARRARDLALHFDCKPELLLVGEAPGYQGCHFSGVPFTSERQLVRNQIPRIHYELGVNHLTTQQTTFAEPSASIVWATLRNLMRENTTWLWNAFAWHPHLPSYAYSNRRPGSRELEAGTDALRIVVNAAIQQDAGIVAVGNVAANLLRDIGAPRVPVRHPAYGGATKFKQGLVEFVGSRHAR